MIEVKDLVVDGDSLGCVAVVIAALEVATAQACTVFLEPSVAPCSASSE